MYSAKIIKDSINPVGDRITTFELTYPRFVHAELMTHRLFSRNSASSRALPTKKILEQVELSPVMPKFWGKSQSGMQANEEFKDGEPNTFSVKFEWLRARDKAVQAAKGLRQLGLHKQIVNRVLEPWMFITVIVTATEYENWYHLRDDPMAQPEIAWVAREMRKLHKASTPKKLTVGKWHLPYIEFDDMRSPLYVGIDKLCRELGINYCDDPSDEPILNALRKIATARCARVSYLTHDGNRSYHSDIKLHDKCRDNGHWSAFEHCAEADGESNRHGNFVGWRQYRKMFKNEHAGRILPV